jgi:hypothetical protein
MLGPNIDNVRAYHVVLYKPSSRMRDQRLKKPRDMIAKQTEFVTNIY